MLDAWIKIKDIKDILWYAKQVDGLINKREFQKAILGCKEYKPPIKKLKRIDNNKVSRVKNAYDIIGNINKYKTNFKGGVFHEYFQYMKDYRLRYDRLRCYCGRECWTERINLYGKTITLYRINDKGGKVELKENDIIFDGVESLMEILRVSKSTISRWIYSDIITMMAEDIFVKVDGYDDFECRIFYYSFDDIKKQIKLHRY